MDIAARAGDRIDVLLTDVLMPEMKGSQLAAEVLKSHPEIQVIYMSGYTGDALAHQGALDREMNFLQKPVTAKDLLEKVERVLKRR